MKQGYAEAFLYGVFDPSSGFGHLIDSSKIEP